VGETRSRGIELDADLKMASNFDISASYLFTDSRVREFPANPELIGKRVPQAARQQFTFQATYRPLEKLVFSVQGRASAGQFDDDLNNFFLRPYFTMDAFGSYRATKRLTVFVAAENVFNNRYDIGLTPERTIAGPLFVRVGMRFRLGRESE
jgi:outer membrane receptor protein involved in Fe transport